MDLINPNRSTAENTVYPYRDGRKQGRKFIYLLIAEKLLEREEKKNPKKKQNKTKQMPVAAQAGGEHPACGICAVIPIPPLFVSVGSCASPQPSVLLYLPTTPFI